MHTDVNTLFDNLWQNYLTVTPSADKIHDLLGSTQKDDIINDLIALRTFNIEKVGLELLAAHFLAIGYKECGEYHFEAKKLYAKHYEHSDPTQPKVFISELLVEKCSTTHSAINTLGCDTYKKLLAESEYAAWMSAWGYRANHFTVNINTLAKFDNIHDVNQALKDAGFALNTSGGEVKGSPEVLLEQSSTLADEYAVTFSDGDMRIPSCFYEFAIRYPKPDGEIYTGFVAASADKIFESTNAR